MDVLLTIGEFSKMTYLSVKALRHYHDVGLLTPADVDPATGYRRYAASQVATAQAIRRFRDLDMPIDDVRDVLRATDDGERNRVILQHLERMQRQLERTQTSVASLQALLSNAPIERVDIELRHLAPMHAMTRHAVVGHDDLGGWLEEALTALHRELAAAGLDAGGPDGAIYPDEFFESGAGEVIAFVPTLGDTGAPSLPEVTVAVLVHEGPFADIDQTYGALGTMVAERGIGDSGPIREHYLSDARAEVCWPVALGAR